MLGVNEIRGKCGGHYIGFTTVRKVPPVAEHRPSNKPDHHHPIIPYRPVAFIRNRYISKLVTNKKTYQDPIKTSQPKILVFPLCSEEKPQFLVNCMISATFCFLIGKKPLG